MGELQKKKSSTNENNININSIKRLSRHDSPSNEKTGNKYEALSLDKIIHQQNFDKKYTQIMSSLSLSPMKQAIFDSPEQKNFLLWDLKIKKDGSLAKDQSLKRLEDLKLRLVYNNQELEVPEEQKLYKNFLNLNTATFKQSNSSDLFKSTNNSESRTLFSSSKNSFYNSANNFNSINNNNLNNNYHSEQQQNNKIENLSFYSYKSFSSKQSKNTVGGAIKNNNKMNSHNNSYNNLSNSRDLLSNLHLNSFGENNSQKRTKRVNFDDFNTIGENPFKININKMHNQINSTRKKVNLKSSDLNISPKNIYSPSKDSISYYPNKRILDIDRLFDNRDTANINNQKNTLINWNTGNINNTNNVPNFKNNTKNILDLNSIKIDLPSSSKSRMNLSPKSNLLRPKEHLSHLLIKNSGTGSNNRTRISSGLQSSRQFTLKKIDNLLKNFSNKSGSFLNNKQENAFKKLVL